MSDPTPNPGTVLIGGQIFDSGLHVFAKYSRPWYRRPGAIRAMQIPEEFEVHRMDGSIQQGASGDYLVGPDESGDYYVMNQLVFENTYEQSTEFEETGVEGGYVEIGDVTYQTGLHAFAKYQRAWYRPAGRIQALQVQEPFTVYREDTGITEEGNAGDYLVGPNDLGDYFVIPQATFLAEWVEVAPPGEDPDDWGTGAGSTEPEEPDPEPE